MQDIQQRDEAHYETLDQVLNLFLTGNKDATSISKELGIPRRDVLDYIAEWRSIANNTEGIKDRATQALHEMDKHYDMIIKKQWEIANDATVNANVRANTLKQIADIESKRQETFQKAGLYDDSGVADQIVEMEEKVDAYETLLLTVATVFPDTKQYIRERIAMLQDEVIVEPMQGEVVTD
jgi:hypothetical protein